MYHKNFSTNMRTFLACALCLLFVLPACAQKKKHPLARLFGIYLMPESELSRLPSARKGLIFANEEGLSGSDGCNSFWGKYSYSATEGFKIGEIASTEKKCLREEDSFSPRMLSAAKTFHIEKNRVIFYGVDGRETGRLFAVENLEASQTLPAGDWKLVACNHPLFEAVRKEKREPFLRVEADKQFVVCYHNEKKGDWRSINYFAGHYNVGEANFMFHINATAGALSMPEGEDAQLAEELRNVSTWALKDKRLIFRQGELEFIFEKL
jgi:hypothetical protein